MISLRPKLITAHHSVSSLSDPAREASPCSRYLRPARDVDTTFTAGRNVHESMATKVRAHRAPNLLRGCVGRSDRRPLRQIDPLHKRGGEAGVAAPPPQVIQWGHPTPVRHPRVAARVADEMCRSRGSH